MAGTMGGAAVQVEGAVGHIRGVRAHGHVVLVAVVVYVQAVRGVRAGRGRRHCPRRAGWLAGWLST